MAHSTITEALLSGLVSGTIASGFIWNLFKPGKLLWLWLACFLLISIFTFFFGRYIPNPFMMWNN